MAQVVGYFEDNPVYEEGPFVIVYVFGWRIEVELKDYHCPVLPDTSVQEIKRSLGLNGKTEDKAQVEKVCDTLNRMVKTGQIVCNERGMWVAA